MPLTIAEGILKSKVDSSEIFVDSAGTGNYHIGGLPDPRSIDVAQKYHIDITNQRCRQFTVEDFDLFDIIYVMDNSNRRDVLSLARHQRDENKVKMILNELFPDENVDVPDPYTGGLNGFEEVYSMLNKACTIVATTITRS